MVTRTARLLSFALLAARVTNSQLVPGGGASLCNASYDQFNATGVFPFSPGGFTAQTANGAYTSSPNSNIPTAKWLVTVGKTAKAFINDASAYMTYYWFNTGGADYWNDEETLFDACAYIILPQELPWNTRLLGADDPGDCSNMLTPACSLALKQQFTASAYQNTAYASIPPNSNLSTGDIPYICEQIIEDVRWYDDKGDYFNFPVECSQDFGYDPGSGFSDSTMYEVVYLTANNRSFDAQVQTTVGSNELYIQPLDQSCHLSGPNDQEYYATYGLGWDSYDNQTRATTPIISVYFSVANLDAREGNVGSILSNADLTCARTTDFSKGSRVSPLLPSGSPYSSSSSSSSLSNGAIAGIAVGCTVAVVLICVAITICFRRRTKRRRQGAEAGVEAKADPDEPTDDSEVPYELHTMDRQELSPADRQELSPIDRKPEVDGAPVLEMGDSGGAVELDARGRHSFDSGARSVLSHRTAAS